MTVTSTDWRVVHDDDDDDGCVWWLTDGKQDIGKMFDPNHARLAAAAPVMLKALVQVSDWMSARSDIAYDDPMHRFLLRIIAETSGRQSRLV